MNNVEDMSPRAEKGHSENRQGPISGIDMKEILYHMRHYYTVNKNGVSTVTKEYDSLSSDSYHNMKESRMKLMEIK